MAQAELYIFADIYLIDDRKERCLAKIDRKQAILEVEESASEIMSEANTAIS